MIGDAAVRLEGLRPEPHLPHFEHHQRPAPPAATEILLRRDAAAMAAAATAPTATSGSAHRPSDTTARVYALDFITYPGWSPWRRLSCDGLYRLSSSEFGGRSRCWPETMVRSMYRSASRGAAFAIAIIAREPPPTTTSRRGRCAHLRIAWATSSGLYTGARCLGSRAM